MRSRYPARVGSLQRIRAHNRSIYPYGDGDPRRVVARAGRKLLRPCDVLGLQGEAGTGARVEETDREECQGGSIPQGQATEEVSLGEPELSRSLPIMTAMSWISSHDESSVVRQSRLY